MKVMVTGNIATDLDTTNELDATTKLWWEMICRPTYARKQGFCRPQSALSLVRSGSAHGRNTLRVFCGQVNITSFLDCAPLLRAASEQMQPNPVMSVRNKVFAGRVHNGEIILPPVSSIFPSSSELSAIRHPKLFTRMEGPPILNV